MTDADTHLATIRRCAEVVKEYHDLAGACWIDSPAVHAPFAGWHHAAQARVRTAAKWDSLRAACVGNDGWPGRLAHQMALDELAALAADAEADLRSLDA